MVYSFELIKHANIRYRDSLSVLSRCELFAMLSSLGISGEIREETMKFSLLYFWNKCSRIGRSLSYS